MNKTNEKKTNTTSCCNNENKTKNNPKDCDKK